MNETKRIIVPTSLNLTYKLSFAYLIFEFSKIILMITYIYFFYNKNRNYIIN